MKRIVTALRRGRLVSGVGAVAAALALTAAVQAPAFAQPGASVRPGAATVPVPTPESLAPAYADCPEDLPEGADRTKWRCEVTAAYGRIKLGGIDLPDIKPITLVHAEGPLPDGTFGQVFGSVRAEPTPVPGAPGLSVRAEYGGYADFLTSGAVDLKFRLASPLLNRACAIGTDGHPVKLRLTKDAPSTWLSQDPPLVRFPARDDTFTTPAATGCGPLGRALNHRFALPAASGESVVTYTAYYTFRTYDRLPSA
ncbi:hypothetical protein ACFZCY_20480 [Streptomyces sp. NPDC007983]|uniref:hypothetical protein n=1 Tax=Streptomyces sp. NPDC007983 TaxID=3364800 RepID=UPI0036E619B0